MQAVRRNIQKHWHVLCNQIGRRYAGTPGEQKAADYIEAHFEKLGLDSVRQHRFEFPNWSYSSKCAVHAGRDRNPVKSSRPLCYSRSTPARGLSGDLVYLESPRDYERDLSGKIGLLIGSLLLGDGIFRKRLMKTGLKGLLSVDSRVPHGWTISQGAAPQWMEDFTIPTVGISYMDGIELVKRMPLKVTIRFDAETFPAESQNVIGEVRGSMNPEQVIVVSAHHDAVWGITGADDNASGVVFVMELARLFAGTHPRRTLRFISYGVEERLSVGAYMYMRSLSRAEKEKLVLAVNADTIASPVGVDSAYISGDSRLAGRVQACWSRRKHHLEVHRELSPYSDHFPLNICGVPSLWLTRPSVAHGGYWTMHSTHDNIANVSPAVIARTIGSTAAFLKEVANAPRFPFARRLGRDIMRDVKRIARREYSHPWDPTRYRYPE